MSPCSGDTRPEGPRFSWEWIERDSLTPVSPADFIAGRSPVPGEGPDGYTWVSAQCEDDDHEGCPDAEACNCHHHEDRRARWRHAIDFAVVSTRLHECMALADSELAAAVGRAETAEAEVERLRNGHWLMEAQEAISERQDAQAERDAAVAALQRVRDLADAGSASPGVKGFESFVSATALRAALDPSPTDGEKP